MITTNYHVHTHRCNHAEGRDRDYVEAAIAAGFSEIATIPPGRFIRTSPG